MTQHQLARRNFFGLLKAKTRYDAEAHFAKARQLSRQFSGVEHFLIKAPGHGGKGEVWYWLTQYEGLPGLSNRDFNDANSYSSPKRYLDGEKPWDDVRANLASMRRPESIPFAVIDTFTEKVEGPLTLTGIATRNPRQHLRRNPSEAQALEAMMVQLLQGLFTIKHMAWQLHWNAEGSQGYSDHLLLERIYTSLDKSIDKLGERFRDYTGQPVPVEAMLPIPGKWSLGSLTTLVRSVKVQADTLRHSANSAAGDGTWATTSGLDDYLMGLNNKLDTITYLLQRVRGV